MRRFAPAARNGGKAQAARITKGIAEEIATPDRVRHPLETIRARMQKLKAARETLLIEPASIKREQAAPLDKIAPKQVEKFYPALQEYLLREPAFAKQYLQLFVSGIRRNKDSTEIKGGGRRLLANSAAEMKKGTLTVPRFMRYWRPHGGVHLWMVTSKPRKSTLLLNNHTPTP